MFFLWNIYQIISWAKREGEDSHCLLLIFAGLVIELRALHMIGKWSILIYQEGTFTMQPILDESGEGILTF
jgi:hypothetical protein